MRHDNRQLRPYGAHVRGMRPVDGPTFGELLRAARKRKGLAQEDVWGNTSATRSTYGRYERDEIDTPDPATVRELCEYLDVNTVDAHLALGWISRDDLDTVIAGAGVVSEFAANLRKVAKVLNDPAVPRHYRAALDHTVGSAFSLWESTVAMNEPREPAGADLVAARERVKRTRPAR